ncbi:MAG: hypothetical protein ACLR4A_03610 [Christensenellales bacterium]
MFGRFFDEEEKERETPVADASAQVPAIATALRSVDGSIIHRHFQFVNPFLHVLIFVISLYLIFKIILFLFCIFTLFIFVFCFQAVFMRLTAWFPPAIIQAMRFHPPKECFS